MYTVWHVDKYKITFKLVINSRRITRPGIIDARARYQSAARRLRNTDLDCTVREIGGMIPACVWNDAYEFDETVVVSENTLSCVLSLT